MSVPNRLRNDRFEVVLQGVADGITALDSAGRMVFANDAAARICGYESAAALMAAPREEIFARFELYREDGTPFPLAELPTRQVLAGGQPPGPVTVRWRARATGEDRWSIIQSSPVLGEDGQVQLAITIFHDVTDRVRQQQREQVLAQVTAALAASLDEADGLRRLASLLAPGLADWSALYLRDEQGEGLQRFIGHADPARVAWVEELTRRWPPDPTSARGAYAVMRSGSAELVSEITDELLVAGADRYGAEYLQAVRQLEMRSWMCVPLRARGQLVGALACVSTQQNRRFGATDLAIAQELADRAGSFVERARLFRAISRAQAAAEAYAARTRLLAEASRAFAEAGIDVERVLTTVARRLVEVVGEACSIRTLSDDGAASLHRVTDMVDPELLALAMHPTMTAPRPAGVGYFGEVLRSGEPVVLARVDPPALEAQYRDAGLGEAVRRLAPKALAVLPLRAGGRVFGVMAVSRIRDPRAYDADELMLLEELADRAALAIDNARLHAEASRALAEREKLIEELERTVHLSELFTGILGHDLRNPLSAITTASSLVLELADSEAISGPVRRIASSAGRMARMIDQLLDFTRVRLGKGVPITRRRVDLAEIARQVTDELRGGADATPFELAVEGDATGLWDEDRLLQLLSNLAGNAVQHRRPGSPVRVAVDGRDAERVRVVVHNHGAIPDDLLPQIFEPLREHERLKRSRSTGLGLGLFICKQIALAHGGGLRAESSEAAGTTLVLELPREPALESGRVFTAPSG